MNQADLIRRANGGKFTIRPLLMRRSLPGLCLGKFYTAGLVLRQKRVNLSLGSLPGVTVVLLQ
jgi:hypothetical protein